MLDVLHKLGGFITGLLLLVTACVVVSMVANSKDRAVDYGIVVQQANESVIVAWDAQDDAVLYEIQGQKFTGEWMTIAWTRGTWFGMNVPLGVSRLRIRAWNTNGPLRWGEPSEYIFVFQLNPPPDDPTSYDDEERQG